MDITRTELQDKAKREAFVESRLDKLGIPKPDRQRDIPLRAEVKQEYSNRIEDELRHCDSLLYGDAATFQNGLSLIEAYMVDWAAGCEAGYKAGASQN